MIRRSLLLASLAPLVAPGAAFAQTPAQAPPRVPPPAGSWFDPTQLPSFNGTVERWLISPGGTYDRMLFREGAQVVFPPHLSERLREAAEPGQPIIVWGVRARSAPVVTMLAWGLAPDRSPNFVDRPAWFTPSDVRGSEPLEASGEIKVPLLSPQGEVIGAILTDFTVLRMPAAAAADRIAVGRRVFASGQGSRRDGQIAMDVERFGREADKMEPGPPARRPAEARP